MKLKADQVKKIAIFRALQLGDLLCSIPAIRALRSAYPSAEITLLSMPWASWLVDRFPAYLNRFIHFPGYPGLPEQPFDAHRFAGFMELMHKEAFDLILQMHGNGTIVNIKVELLGAKHTAGFFMQNDYC